MPKESESGCYRQFVPLQIGNICPSASQPFGTKESVNDVHHPALFT